MKHYQVTVSDALAAHEQALRFGGLAGISSLPLIESAIGRPYTGYYRFIYQKAAALLESLVNNHGFTDGNKRSALLITDLFIRRSGYRLHLKDGELVDDVIVDVASGALTYPDLESWFRARLIKQ